MYDIFLKTKAIDKIKFYYSLRDYKIRKLESDLSLFFTYIN